MFLLVNNMKQNTCCIKLYLVGQLQSTMRLLVIP